jgi:hypothetical protein
LHSFIHSFPPLNGGGEGVFRNLPPVLHCTHTVLVKQTGLQCLYTRKYRHLSLASILLSFLTPFIPFSVFFSPLIYLSPFVPSFLILFLVFYSLSCFASFVSPYSFILPSFLTAFMYFILCILLTPHLSQPICSFVPYFNSCILFPVLSPFIHILLFIYSALICYTFYSILCIIFPNLS